MKTEDLLKLIGKMFDAVATIGGVFILVPRILSGNPPLNTFEIAILASIVFGLLFSIISDLVAERGV